MAEGTQVRFEGIRDGGEFWGGTQADFLLVPEEGGSREVSIVLSDVAASALAEASSLDNTAEFRARAARETGGKYIESALAEGRRVAPSVVVTADMVAG